MKKYFLILLLFLSHDALAQSFEGLSDSIATGGFGNLKAVIVSHHGEVVFEGYFRGTHADSLHQVHSVTKSVGSALIGIAHRQGKIELGQNLGQFFSGLYNMSQGALQSKTGITVEQVLQQRHGIAWDEDSTDYRSQLNPAGQMINSVDWYQYVLTRPMDATPGTKFSYSTGVSTLMSRLVRVSTGLAPDVYATQELFAPLGISSTHWELYSTQGMGNGLTQWRNPDGDVSLGFTLWLKARDMLKIGQLYLNGGEYNGKRILDESWIDASWTRYTHPDNSSNFTNPGSGYGYQWWATLLTDLTGREFTGYYAAGWGHQYIFIVPELALIVVTTADNYDYAGPGLRTLLEDHVLPELALSLDARFNGSWYNPDTDGQGFSLEVLDQQGTAVAYWYTYTATGEQRWFVLQGNIVDGVGEMTIYESTGGVFLQDDTTSLDVWGNGRFIAVNCQHINFEFESADISATIPLTRLTGECAEHLD